jgi:hypothetical protein
MAPLPTLNDAGGYQGQIGTLSDASSERGITRVVPGITGYGTGRLGNVYQFGKRIGAMSFEIDDRWRDLCQFTVRRQHVATVIRLIGRSSLAGDDFPVRARGRNPRSVGSIRRHIESRSRTPRELKRKKHKRS